MKPAALAVVLLVSLAPALAAGAADVPAEQITWAVHTTLVPTYFDPAETTIITSFMVLSALHDAVRSSPSSTASVAAWTNPASG